MIPVVEAPGSILCPVRFLRRVFELAPGQPGGPLFHKGGLPYTYNYYAKQLKLLCARVGLIGDYGTHSVRRGSATFLSTSMPLHDVKRYGDWKSWAVLLYLSDDYATRKDKEARVAKNLRFIR